MWVSYLETARLLLAVVAEACIAEARALPVDDFWAQLFHCSIWFGTNSMWQRCAVPFAANSCFPRPKKGSRNCSVVVWNIGACARRCSVVVCFSFVVREKGGHTFISEHCVEALHQLRTAVVLDRHGNKKLKIRRKVCRNHRHPASKKKLP